jgi:hypothetical protein
MLVDVPSSASDSVREISRSGIPRAANETALNIEACLSPQRFDPEPGRLSLVFGAGQQLER